MIEIKYQTFWRRFWAVWIDSIVFIPLALLDEWIYSRAWSGEYTYAYYIVSTLCFYIYSIAMHGRFGQTVGKILMKVKLLSVNGEELGYKKAFYRDSVAIIIMVILIAVEAPHILGGLKPGDYANTDAAYTLANYVLISWFVAELVTMLFNKKRRAIHDYIAGSVVIRL